MANPGGRTSISPHVADSVRAIFGERGKCGSAGIFAISGGPLGLFRRFLVWVLNDPHSLIMGGLH